MELRIGNNDWPFPTLIVQKGRWHRWVFFDTKSGAKEIINRRISNNERAAIRVARSYVDAQKDYFARMVRQTGTGFYAERLISTPGHQDGLYWTAAAGASESPFAPLVARAESEGYPGKIVRGKTIPYQGYYFRVLKAESQYTRGRDELREIAPHDRRLRADSMAGYIRFVWDHDHPGRSGRSGFPEGPGDKHFAHCLENHPLRSRPDLGAGRNYE
jgi:Protein of unknown function (DUF2950)